jgi:hypothetical protein
MDEMHKEKTNGSHEKGEPGSWVKISVHGSVEIVLTTVPCQA